MIGNTSGDDTRMGLGFLRTALGASLIGVAASLLLSLIFSAAALAMADPGKVIGAFGYAALLLGAVISGTVGIKLDAEQNILSSLVSGAGYVLVIWLVSLFFRSGAENAASPLIMVLVYVGCAAAAMAGGLIGRTKKRRIKTAKNNPTDIIRKQLGRR